MESIGEVAPPGDWFLAVRLGEVQKQARLVPLRIYRFPSISEGGSLDLLRRVGTVPLQFAPGKQQDIKLPCGDDAAAQFDFVVSYGNSGQPASSSSSTDCGKLVKETAKADASRAYLQEHQLELMLAEAMREVMWHKPRNPRMFLSNYMARPLNQKAELVEEAAAETGTKVNRVAAEPGKDNDALLIAAEALLGDEIATSAEQSAQQSEVERLKRELLDTCKKLALTQERLSEVEGEVKTYLQHTTQQKLDETEKQVVDMQEKLGQLIQQTLAKPAAGGGAAAVLQQQAKGPAVHEPADKLQVPEGVSLKQQLGGIDSKLNLTLRHLAELRSHLHILLKNASAEVKYRMQQKLATEAGQGKEHTQAESHEKPVLDSRRPNSEEKAKVALDIGISIGGYRERSPSAERSAEIEKEQCPEQRALPGLALEGERKGGVEGGNKEGGEGKAGDKAQGTEDGGVSTKARSNLEKSALDGTLNEASQNDQSLQQSIADDGIIDGIIEQKLATIEQIQTNIVLKDSAITDLQKRIQELEAALAQPIIVEDEQLLSSSPRHPNELKGSLALSVSDAAKHGELEKALTNH